jgi:two-component system KDP operon response regulator KdpE
MGAPSRPESLTGVEQLEFDLVVADLTLSDPATDDLCHRLHTCHHVPMLVLSAETTSAARITAFDLGADQYLTKPFMPQELAARLRALARHVTEESASPPHSDTLPHAEGASPRVILLEETHEAWIDERRAHLTPTEFHLLRELLSHAGQTVPHRDLLRRIWGPVYAEEIEYLKVFVQRLRRKLGDSAAQPHLIQTDWGIGYRFGCPDSEPA